MLPLCCHLDTRGTARFCSIVISEYRPVSNIRRSPWLVLTAAPQESQWRRFRRAESGTCQRALLPRSAFGTTNTMSLPFGGAHSSVFMLQFALFIGLLFKLNPFNFRSYSAKFPSGAVAVRPPFNIVESDQNRGAGFTVYIE